MEYRNDSNLALEQIAAAIAHEVKNPLTLVKANVDLLQANDLSEAHSKNYDMIRAELDRINEIMMDFICLAKPAEYDNDIVYLYDILKEISRRYAVAHGGLAVTLQPEDTDIAVLGCVKNLNILFGNMMKNAVEATGAAGHIEISIKRKGGNAVVAIADDGCGMPKEMEGKVFESLFTTKKTGSGLGLSICAKIAGEHGGAFTIKNNEYGGCTATVTIPEYGDDRP